MIKEIKLTNFRGFEEHTIPLNTLGRVFKMPHLSQSMIAAR